MKKIFAVAMVCILILCSCAYDDEHGEVLGELSDTDIKEITAVDAQTLETVELLDREDDIRAFIDSLNISEWSIGELPDDSEILGSFELFEEEILDNAKNGDNKSLYSAFGIHIYKNVSYVTFRDHGTNKTYEVPQETSEYLRGFFYDSSKITESLSRKEARSADDKIIRF